MSETVSDIRLRYTYGFSARFQGNSDVVAAVLHYSINTKCQLIKPRGAAAGQDVPGELREYNGSHWGDAFLHMKTKISLSKHRWTLFLKAQLIVHELWFR